MSLKSKYTFARFREQVIEFLLLACAFVSILTTVGIIVVLLTESVYSFGKEPAFFQQIGLTEFFLGTHWAPIIDKAYGVLPLVWGTVLVAGIAALTGLPLGLLAAIYLSEYAHPRVRGIVKPFLEILAGIPTLVFGYFALRFITPVLIRPFFENLLGLEVGEFNALSAGIVVGIMIIPMVCSISEDAIRAVPRSLREAGYALGSTKFDVCVRIVVPAATSGIIASFLLAISRAIGETMAVVIA
ncbi:MAG: phosphate ABC transporter permease subunit PstC, partial [Planctomycetaceae bacterium]|nr:phosphate ABC transporter permease subunit PstC [Planctomycetaceae bacterium]